ncbi:mite allergen Der f 3 [Anabrus simplex]|uniref:mite allergen Der f 3 n=1 Tax=Anabrus simplex TaxID=316456 RepID=UPI0035A38CCB
MLRITLLVVLVAVTGTFAGVRQRVPLLEWSRIVNGVDAADGEYPSQLSLQYYGSHSCGASILSANWALTAAHCVSGRSPSSLSLLAGTNKLNSGGSRHPVSQIIVHEQYSASNSWINDIAVLKVSTPFSLDSRRQAVKLPAQGLATADNSRATVIGWGRLRQNGAIPNELQKVDILIANQAQCRSVYNSMGYNIYDSQICADVPEGGKGSCNGDSGGPLFVGGTVVGLVSWANGCATRGYPTVYNRVSSYRNWIAQKTGV